MITRIVVSPHNSDYVAFVTEGRIGIYKAADGSHLYDIKTESGQTSDISFAPLDGLVAVTQSSTTWALHNFLSQERLLER